jgi:hypothetical protein
MFFQWKIIDIIAELLILPVLLLVFGFFISITIRALITLFKNKAWKPIVITILLLLFIPFNKIILNMDFKLNKSEREEIVIKVEKNELKPNISNGTSLIHLPKKNEHLSSGGHSAH